MPEQPPPLAPVPTPAPPPPEGWLRRQTRTLFALRGQLALWQEVLLGLLCVAVIYGLWWYVTRGDDEHRILSAIATSIYSPEETFREFPSLWFDRELTRNIWVTLRRVTLGFALAAVVGIPLGVLCGCFPSVNAFFVPVMIFGRNIPIAALIPLTFGLFGIGEQQKVLFIFLAAVAFVMSDTARAVLEIGTAYIDTAYTLGANRWQVIMKVLVPLAMPAVFNSLRLLYGLAFGYIMLAETIKFGSETGGLGDIINTSFKRGPREHILLVLLIIPLVALAIDRLLFWIQRELFPYRYGGAGILNQGLGLLLHGWDDLKSLFWKPSPGAAIVLTQERPPEATKP